MMWKLWLTTQISTWSAIKSKVGSGRRNPDSVS